MDAACPPLTHLADWREALLWCHAMTLDSFATNDARGRRVLLALGLDALQRFQRWQVIDATEANWLRGELLEAAHALPLTPNEATP